MHLRNKPPGQRLTALLKDTECHRLFVICTIAQQRKSWCIRLFARAPPQQINKGAVVSHAERPFLMPVPNVWSDMRVARLAWSPSLLDTSQQVGIIIEPSRQSEG
jgi:hypothetical protein